MLIGPIYVTISTFLRGRLISGQLWRECVSRRRSCFCCSGCWQRDVDRAVEADGVQLLRTESSTRPRVGWPHEMPEGHVATLDEACTSFSAFRQSPTRSYLSLSAGMKPARAKAPATLSRPSAAVVADRGIAMVCWNLRQRHRNL